MNRKHHTESHRDKTYIESGHSKTTYAVSLGKNYDDHFRKDGCDSAQASREQVTSYE
jgi:hypothetical protein